MLTLQTSTFRTSAPTVSISYRQLTPHNLPYSAPVSLKFSPALGLPTQQNDVNFKVFAEPYRQGVIVNFVLRPSCAIQMESFSATYDVGISGKRMMANGFQSWSQTKELDHKDRILNIPRPIAWLKQTHLQG